MLRTPNWPRQVTEPADPHLESLPSAPPLPEAQANVLYAASSSQSAGSGNAERSMYPSLYASTHSGSALRPDQSQSRQTHEAPRMREQTGGGSLGSADGRGAETAVASPAVKPAGSLAWAMDPAAGDSSAAVTALTAWLPWQHDSSTASKPQQKPQAALQAGSRTGRCARKFNAFARLALPCKRS